MPRKKRTRATASSLPMMSACPKFESDNSGPKPHADFGTLFHKAIETGDPSILFTEEAQSLGREAGKTRSQTESAYAWALEFLDRLKTEYDIMHEQSELNGQCSLLPGRNFYIDQFFLCDDGRKAVVLDWKTSRNLDNYQADACEQGWLYVAAIFELSPVIEEVDMIFAAPFCEDDEEYRTSRFTYTREDSVWLTETIAAIVKAADLKKSEPTACSYCTWCAHYRRCPETTSIVAPAMEDRFGEVLERAKQSPILMSKLRDCVPVLEQVIEDIKREANSMYFDHGQTIPGYQAVETKGRTTVQDHSAILTSLVQTFDLGIFDLVDYVKVDLSGVETIVRNSVPRGEGGKAVDDFRERCERAGWTKTGSGSVYLKKSKHKKEIDA